MLKYKADIRTLVFLATATALLFVQWHYGFYWLVYILSLYLAVTVAVIAHNHNHVETFESPVMNRIMDYWITLFYGFPAFAWKPTHNLNHHKFINKEGDFTITYRISEKNNALTLLSYPAISSYFQQSPISQYLQKLWKNKRTEFFLAIFQYIALFTFIGIALYIDWRKAVLYIVIPQQFALFSVLVFNYIQHVHADEESAFNHSRNFISPLTDFMLFNNGYHTAHHYRAAVHWSKLKETHASIADKIDPGLIETGFWPYIFRVYIFSCFASRFGTRSMRLVRKKHEVAQ